MTEVASLQKDRLPSLELHPDMVGRAEVLGCFAVKLDAAVSRINATAGLAEWLHAHDVSLVFSACDLGCLLLVGVSEGGRLEVSQYGIDHSTGISVRGSDLVLGTRNRVIHFARSKAGQRGAIFQPVKTYQLGQIDVHEVVIATSGIVAAVATASSCIVSVRASRGSMLLWKPWFTSEIRREDRCHLNGFHVEGAELLYATAFKACDEFQGWKSGSSSEGVLMSIPENRVLVEGLTRPHSPRLHDGALYVLDSGRGLLKRMRPDGTHAETVAFLPGFLRGLSFHAGHAAVTASLPRHGKTYELPLDRDISDRGATPMSGVYIVDLGTGEIRHTIAFTTGIREMFDVKFLPGLRQVRFQPGSIED